MDETSFALGIVLTLLFLGLLFLLASFVPKREALNVYCDPKGQPPNPENRQPGIPFYIKTSRVLHETTYLETLVTYTLSATKVEFGDNDTVVQKEKVYSGCKTVSWSDDIKSKINELYGLLKSSTGAKTPEKKGETNNNKHPEMPESPECLLEKIKGTFDNLSEYDGSRPPEAALRLVGNSCREEVYVDYSTKYFLNAILPLNGASDITTELSADGTLSKASAKTEDNTVEKVLDTLPISKMFGFSDTSTDNGPSAQPTTEEASDQSNAGVAPKTSYYYHFELASERTYIHHILFEYLKDCTVINSGTPSLSPISLGDKRIQPPASPPKCEGAIWYRREFTSELKPKEEKKDDPPASDKKTT